MMSVQPVITNAQVLREHLSSVVTIMKLSKTPDDFKRNVNSIHPRFGDTIDMDFNATE